MVVLFNDVRYTTTSNSNVTSTTNDFDDEWSAAYEEFNTSMVNGRAYFAVSNTLMCAWRGRSTGSSLYDSVPMYPLTPEPKFGWYSSGGHILACAGPYQARDAYNFKLFKYEHVIQQLQQQNFHYQQV